MIHHAGFSPDDTELSEVPEIELEFIEVSVEDAIVLMPGTVGNIENKAREIVASVKAMANTIQLFPASKYSTPQCERYIIPQDDGSSIEVCMFSASYESMKHEMRIIQRSENLVGTGSNKIIVGIKI